MAIKENQPLVSIGLPVYNGERFIRRALDSLAGQNYSNLEIIVSDNGSTDSTPELIRQFARRDSRVRLHFFESNQGPRANFLKTLELAAGKYFMWAADDDWWHPDFVPRLVDELEAHPQVVIGFCAVERVSDEGALNGVVRFEGRDDPNTRGPLGLALGLAGRLKYNLFIYGMFRRTMLQAAARNLIQIPAAERWFLIQFALSGRFRCVDRVLYRRTTHGTPYHQRYKDDVYGRLQLEAAGKRIDFEPVRAVAKMVSGSPIVPFRRKLLLPVVLGYLIYRQLAACLIGFERNLESRLANRLPDGLRQTIRRRLRRVR